MAKNAEGPSKSQLIRDYMTAHPDAAPKDIKAALGTQGVDVSDGLISVIKYGGNKKAAGAKPGKKGRKAAAGAAANGSARGARSDAIRAYLQAHPEATAGQVMEGLKGQGVEVSIGLVSNIKSRLGIKGKRGRRARTAAAAPVAARKSPAAASRGSRSSAGMSAGISAKELVDVKRLVNMIGGISQTRAALDALEEILAVK